MHHGHQGVLARAQPQEAEAEEGSAKKVQGVASLPRRDAPQLRLPGLRGQSRQVHHRQRRRRRPGPI